MPANRWQLGVMYYGGRMNGQAFFTQPDGPGTQVLPTQQNAQPWPDYPIPGLIINEYVPWWSPGCGHSIRYWSIIREYDVYTELSVALVCCSVCSYVQRAIEPFEEYLNPIQEAIIVG